MMKKDICLKCQHSHKIDIDVEKNKFFLICYKKKGKTYRYMECRYIRVCPLNVELIKKYENGN